MSFSLEHMVMQRGNQAAVNNLVEGYESDLDALEAKLAAAEKRAADAERKARELALALRVQEAHSLGMLAQAKAFAAKYPNDPLLAYTGKIDSLGKREKVIHRDYYNPAHDKHLREHKISDPARFRG